MKNKDIYKVKIILEKWAENHKGRMSYAIFKNIEIVDTLINTFKRFKVLDINDYEREKKLICDKYSVDIVDNEYIIEDKDNFNKDMDDLDYNFLKVNQLMNSECDVQFYKVSKDDLPVGISVKDLKDMSFMIK